MKLAPGGKYISRTGNAVRVIERLEGNDVYWRDDVGAGCCTRGTFQKWAGKIETDSDGLPPMPVVNAPVLDRYATNKLLESYLILQNQLDSWVRMLNQTAEYHWEVLTPSQKEAVQEAVKGGERLREHLQRFQASLTK